MYVYVVQYSINPGCPAFAERRGPDDEWEREARTRSRARSRETGKTTHRIRAGAVRVGSAGE